MPTSATSETVRHITIQTTYKTYTDSVHQYLGNVHSSIICPQSHYSAAIRVINDIARLALSLEGTVTGEHGVGMKLRDALEEEVGSEGVEMMRGIKNAVDPRGILNPGKVFRLEGDGEGGGVKL